MLYFPNCFNFSGAENMSSEESEASAVRFPARVSSSSSGSLIFWLQRIITGLGFRLHDFLAEGGEDEFHGELGGLVCGIVKRIDFGDFEREHVAGIGNL